MSAPGFWDNQQNANKTIAELKELKQIYEPFETCQKQYEELKELANIVGEKDTSSISHLNEEISKLEKYLSDLEFKTLLSGENDKSSAILSINAGAGGTESCDWAGMLLRMYSRWAQSKNYEVQIIDYLAGEEAGVKNVTILVRGDWAYGYLKTENGVHRLVRISPFDANKRRHTSFASVDVIPQISDEIKIEIEEKDLRIDVYRASGPGGQGVNTTDSAVRITHIPTGIVVQCQNERSQLKNKNIAMKILRARLYEKKMKEQQEKLAKQYAEKMDIAWGSQIRSYVMHPYNMVKDHRTEVETGNVGAVMDGEIDMFIEAYLKSQKSKGKS